MGFWGIRKMERGAVDYKPKLLNDELGWLDTKQSGIVRF